MAVCEVIWGESSDFVRSLHQVDMPVALERAALVDRLHSKVMAVRMCEKLVLVCIIMIEIITWLDTTMASADTIFACDREVYCKGTVLHAVQMARVYPDSKTFVDMRYKMDPLEAKAVLEQGVRQNYTRAQWIPLLEEAFHPPGGELIDSDTPDWIEEPPIIKRIKDGDYAVWANYLNEVWKKLTRKMKNEVKDNRSRTSLIYSKNAFVVPGGRFREFYYWDTYWAVSGLLICGMEQTVAGMIENLLDLVDQFGFVPNGGRIYYENRSQPPFLTLMVDEYFSHTNDLEFVRKSIDRLSKEHEFWVKNRMVDVVSSADGKTYRLYQYASGMGYPRPESYYEDVMTMHGAGYSGDYVSAGKLFSHIASAAESGWDFSSRWFDYTGLNALKMTSIRTTTIIPVCLNSILCRVEQELSKFYGLLGDSVKAKKYNQIHQNTRNAIDRVLWNEGFGQWLDFDILKAEHRKHFYVSNIYPLWTGAYKKDPIRVAKVINSLKSSGALDYVGGVPTSLIQTEQQWDFPNAWPPLQDIMEIALRESGNEEGKQMAFDLAKKWLESNFKAWEQTGHMFEKYDVTISGNPGHGGEYEVQIGFGWTNGVIFKFLDRYGQNITAPSSQSSGHKLQANILFISITSFSVILAASLLHLVV